MILELAGEAILAKLCRHAQEHILGHPRIDINMLQFGSGVGAMCGGRVLERDGSDDARGLGHWGIGNAHGDSENYINHIERH